MLRRTSRTLAVIALTMAVGCGSDAPAVNTLVQPVTLTLHQTLAAAPLANDLIAAYQQQNSDVRFEQTTSNHASGLQRVQEEITSYLISQHLPSETDLWAAPLAQDGLGLIVHTSNPVRGLSAEQLRRIYRGFITNWREVGGEDRTIMLYTREAGSGMRLEFERLVMGQQPISPNAQVLPGNQAMLAEIAQEPGGIGFMPLTQVSAEVRLLAINGIDATRATLSTNRYPLRYTLYIMGQSAPEGPYRAFLDWVQSGVGQTIVAQSVVPLPD